MSRPNVARFVAGLVARGHFPRGSAHAASFSRGILPIVDLGCRGGGKVDVEGAYGPLMRVSDKGGLVGFARADEDAVMRGLYDGRNLVGLCSFSQRGRRTSFRFVSNPDSGQTRLEPDSAFARLPFKGRFRVLYEVDTGSKGSEIFLSDNVVGLLRAN